MFFKNLLFTSIIVVGFFAMVELVLALAGIRPLLLTEDPLVGFAENIPQFIKATRKDGAAMYITAKNKMTLFNFQEFPQRKSDNAYRIFCVGGSTTYGRPYRDRLSFCGWLRAYLQAADHSREWEVINAGGISYASYRVARVMNELVNYQPDLFIVYSGQNEFLEQRSYAALQTMPSWIVDLNATLSGTRLYTAMKRTLNAFHPAAGSGPVGRDQLDVEVDDILNHTMGPESYHRDEVLKQQIILHYRLNLQRMARIADSVDAGIVFVKPAINIRDLAPFKSEHRNDLGIDALMNWQGLFSDARQLHKADKQDEALLKYQQALEIDDRYAELHYRIGQILFQQHRYDEAETALRRAVEEDVAPLRILASMQQVVEDVALSEDVPLIDFPEILRQAYIDEYGHSVFGVEYFTDHVHTNVEGYRQLGMALFEQLVDQDIARADASWNEAGAEALRQNLLASIDKEDQGITFLNLGAVFEWAGKFEEARTVLLRALEVLGPEENIFMRLASSSYSTGRLEEAFNYLLETQKLDPKVPGLNTKLGMIRLEQGNTDEAMTYCIAELEQSPANHLPHVCIAKALVARGEHDIAQLHLDTALKLEPWSEVVRLTYADFLARSDRLDEALVHGRAALGINPVDYKAHNVVGSILIKQGNLEQARHHISESLRLQPDYDDARKNLSLLQAGAGLEVNAQPNL